ncbi:MAG: caspase family protein [Gemmataceae bacterium]
MPRSFVIPRLLVVAAVGVLVLTAGGPWASAASPELRKIHILTVLDTQASELAPSLMLDERRLRDLWRQTIPADRYTLTVLKGKQATRGVFLDQIRALAVQPDEGLVVYYGGHGATDTRTKQHFFDFSDGKPLFRQEVLRAMEAKGPALAVLLSDCCSTPKKLKELATTRAVPAPPAQSLHPTVRSLFFQSRGTVDVTAATDNASWSDSLQGGLFTRSLDKLLLAPVSDRDKQLTWTEFFPRLQRETRLLFDSWRKDMTARGERIDSRNQVPHLFEHRLAVVGIENGTAGPLAYQVRWPGQAAWAEVTLQPGEQRMHRTLLADGDTPPRLEAKFTGVRKPQELTAGLWTGVGEPAEAPKLYRIRPRN